MPIQYSGQFWCSQDFLNFPVHEHSDDSELVKRSVCKKLEYIYAIMRKSSDINVMTHSFFDKFRQIMLRQYLRYCDIALLQYGYHKKYFEVDLDFFEEKFDIATCIHNYLSFKDKKFRFMVIVFFLRHICKELRLKFRKRKWDIIQSEE